MSQLHSTRILQTMSLFLFAKLILPYRRGCVLHFHLLFIDFCSFHFICPQSLTAFGQKNKRERQKYGAKPHFHPHSGELLSFPLLALGQTAPYKSYRQPFAYPRNGPAGITYNLNNVCNAGVPPVTGQWPVSAFQRSTHKQSITEIL